MVLLRAGVCVSDSFQPLYGGFCLVLLYLFLMCLAVVSWRPTLFQRRNGMGEDLVEKGYWGELRGVGGRETVVWMHLFSIKNNITICIEKDIEKGLDTLTPVTFGTKHQNVQSVRIIIGSSFCPFEKKNITYFIPSLQNKYEEGLFIDWVFRNS